MIIIAMIVVLDQMVQRGNLNTRLKKLDENGQYDALILAKAGLDRLNWKDRINQVARFSVV